MRFAWIVLLAVTMVELRAAPGTHAERSIGSGVPPGYALAWSDEFDGLTLDASKWEHRGLGARRDAVNVREAVTLDGNGHLVLTTSRAGTEYHTAMIATQGKFEPTYGYFEVRVRMQREIGHWSAFWLQSPAYGAKIGNTADSGTEIDVFEYLANKPGTFQHALHWDGYGADHKEAVHLVPAPGVGDGWHTIGFLWTPDEYVFSFDGRETWRTRQAVSRRPQYLILSLEVGHWAGDISKAQLPDSLLVDYVRVWEHGGGRPEFTSMRADGIAETATPPASSPTPRRERR